MLLGTILILVGLLLQDGRGKIKKSGFKHLKNYNHDRRNASSIFGLRPSSFNLATKALITVNATCGENGREEFCRATENGRGRCGICDNFSTDPNKKHPISYAIDGTNKWWQSPALAYGAHNEYIRILIDLKQVYQISDVIIKAANSLRPGLWILEHSLDNKLFQPWQYFARSDRECLERFGVPPTKGKPHYFTDTEVICTSFYSKWAPLENGEIHTSLIHGRPGANEASPELLQFSRARFVRMSLMGLRGTAEPVPRWLAQDLGKEKKMYYTIRDISIVGHCVCNGHAENCRYNVASGHPQCECEHHTCGSHCEKCCPLYNQQLWGPGSSRDARECLPCNCHGHSTSCHYDEDVDKAGLSMDIHGNYQGGGVCDNCTGFTTGINCEKCLPKYYRLHSSLKKPCLKCDCDFPGSDGTCAQEGRHAGTCNCLPGYEGIQCELCSVGYKGWPKCESCPCDYKGIVEMEDCEADCQCKENVEGKFCDRCKSGHFALQSDNLKGCLPCYCSGVTTLCQSALLHPKKVQTLEGWLTTNLKMTDVNKPLLDNEGLFASTSYELANMESVYWLAPSPYLGNKLDFYGSIFEFRVQWVIMRGDTSGRPTIDPTVVLMGHNGLKIAYGSSFYPNTSMRFGVGIKETGGWYHLPQDIKKLENEYFQGEPVSRSDFLGILANVSHILLRATFHTDQIETLLEEATLEILPTPEISPVEKCSCPSGYTGLSCESCAFGYVKIITNTTSLNGVFGEQDYCGKCDCNGHSETCSPDTGECSCEHNTIGEKCERCQAGFYGNPLRGTKEDCKKCACPLLNDENNFSPSCQMDYLNENLEEEERYVCTQCPKGYTGDHCEICDDGFYGSPASIGGSCKLCNCDGAPCNRVTGQCLSCKGHTEGWRCEKCKPGYYGDALTSNCIPCQCDPLGSSSRDCHIQTGQCECRERFTDRTCNKCETGYGNITALCTPCQCSPVGSKSSICDQHTGLCQCQDGVEGFHCDTCQYLHYGLSEVGCKRKCFLNYDAA